LLIEYGVLFMLIPNILVCQKRLRWLFQLTYYRCFLLVSRRRTIRKHHLPLHLLGDKINLAKQVIHFLVALFLRIYRLLILMLLLLGSLTNILLICFCRLKCNHVAGTGFLRHNLILLYRFRCNSMNKF